MPRPLRTRVFHGGLLLLAAAFTLPLVFGRAAWEHVAGYGSGYAFIFGLAALVALPPVARGRLRPLLAARKELGVLLGLLVALHAALGSALTVAGPVRQHFGAPGTEGTGRPSTPEQAAAAGLVALLLLTSLPAVERRLPPRWGPVHRRWISATVLASCFLATLGGAHPGFAVAGRLAVVGALGLRLLDTLRRGPPADARLDLAWAGGLTAYIAVALGTGAVAATTVGFGALLLALTARARRSEAATARPAAPAPTSPRS